MRLLILLFIIVTFKAAHGAVPKNVLVTYVDGEASINYAGLDSWREVSRITLDACISSPDSDEKGERIEGCKSGDTQDIAINNDKTFSIDSNGSYYVNFYSRCLMQGVCFPRGREASIWRQYVVNFGEPTPDLRLAIINHQPKFSFFPDEEYFPVSIEELFDRSLRDFSSDRYYIRAPYEFLFLFSYGLVDDAASAFMAANGHADNKIKLSGNRARELNGSRNDYPVYWYYEKVNDDVAWVTYFLLFGYDKKYWQYIGDRSDPSALLGDHAIDRESVSIEFYRAIDGWKPRSVVYAGHLEDQRTFFQQCGDPATCAVEGVPTEDVSWPNGRTRVPWEQASQQGGGPVAYVAHGSHAMYPGFGWYYVDAGPTDFVDVTEPAGSPDAGFITSPRRLIALDLSNPSHAALTYSGYLIDGIIPGSLDLFGDWHRAHPFVRYPTSRWASAANFDFSDCVENEERGCRQYIHGRDDTDSIDFAKAAEYLLSVERFSGANVGDVLANYIAIARSDQLTDLYNELGEVVARLRSASPNDPYFSLVSGDEDNGTYSCADGGSVGVIDFTFGSEELDRLTGDKWQYDFVNCLLDDREIHGIYNYVPINPAQDEGLVDRNTYGLNLDIGIRVVDSSGRRGASSSLSQALRGQGSSRRYETNIRGIYEEDVGGRLLYADTSYSYSAIVPMGSSGTAVDLSSLSDITANFSVSVGVSGETAEAANVFSGANSGWRAARPDGRFDSGQLVLRLRDQELLLFDIEQSSSNSFGFSIANAATPASPLESGSVPWAQTYDLAPPAPLALSPLSTAAGRMDAALSGIATSSQR